MTYRQKIILTKINERIDDLRNMFDDLLVESPEKDQLTDDQLSILTEANNHIIEASELLYTYKQA